MSPQGRYQIGDDICGQVDRCGRKHDALSSGLVHWRKHRAEGSPTSVKVVDCMRRKTQADIVWEFKAES